MGVGVVDPAAMNGVFDAVLWMGVLLVVVGAGVGLLLGVRRKLLRDADRIVTHLSLDELIRLRDAGGVSDAEYAAIRKAVIREMSPSIGTPVSGAADKRVQQPGRS